MPDCVLESIDQPNVPKLSITSRLRGQLVYFAAGSQVSGAPMLGENEYWFDPDEVRRNLEDGVIEVISPLDTLNKTEVELSEEQESLLEWLAQHGVRHVRVVAL